jgi:hypothetical protein
MRLYYGILLRRIYFMPKTPNLPAEFRFQLIRDHRVIKTYDCASIEGIIKELKKDGHQVWGKDVLDYALPPTNALEYVLMSERMKAQGMSDAEIDKAFTLTD